MFLEEYNVKQRGSLHFGFCGVFLRSYFQRFHLKSVNAKGAH
jgi:hypothetical protein